MSLNELPTEIQLLIISYAPNLRQTSSYYYALYNELYRLKVKRLLGQDYDLIIEKTAQELAAFVNTFDGTRLILREVVRRHLLDYDASNSIQSVQDSWPLIYEILSSKRIYPEKKCFVLHSYDRFDFRQYNGVDADVLIDHAYNVLFMYHTKLLPGTYGFQVAVALEDFNRGFSNIRFSVRCEIQEIWPDDSEPDFFGWSEGRTDVSPDFPEYYEVPPGIVPVTTVAKFYPSSMIANILPKQKFVILELGSFTVTGEADRWVQAEIIVEETGGYSKAGIQLFHLSLMPYHGFKGFLYWTPLNCPGLPGNAKEYYRFVPPEEKNFYRKFNHLLCFNAQDDVSEMAMDPTGIEEGDEQQRDQGMDVISFNNRAFRSTNMEFDFQMGFHFTPMYRQRAHLERLTHLQDGDYDVTEPLREDN